MTEIEQIEGRFIAKALLKLGGKHISENYAMVKSMGIKPEMFTNPTCRVIWMATEEIVGGDISGKFSFSDIMIRAKQMVRNKDLVKSVKDIDLSSANPSREFIESVDPVEGEDDIEGFYGRLRDAYAAREFKKLYEKTLDAFYGGTNAMDAIAMMQSGCDGIIRDAQIGGDGPDIRQIVGEVIADFRDVYHHRQELGERDYVAGMPMAWPKMTSLLGGVGSVLTTIAARTGVGKTSFGVALMRYWLRTGKKVVFDSLDMESRELVIRQMSEGALVASKALKNGEIGPERFESVITAYENAGEELARYSDEGRYKLLEEYDVDVLASKVRILHNQGKCDVLMVDYVQLLEAKHTKNEYDRITYATKALMRIANKVKIPVFALAQINRSPAKEGEDPELHDIKGSGEIEQDSANILILIQNKKLKDEWAANPPTQYVKNPAYTQSLNSLMPMWVKLAKTRDAPPNHKLPFVVFQGKYSWYLGDTEAEGDAKFARVHLNPWKSDPIENVWKNNGAVIDDEYMYQVETFNEQHRNSANSEGVPF